MQHNTARLGRPSTPVQGSTFDKDAALLTPPQSANPRTNGKTAAKDFLQCQKLTSRISSSAKSRRVNGRPVLVIVGQGSSEKDFYVHESLATSSSEFLRAALSGQWLESIEKIVRLPNEDPVLFEVYFGFLYEGGITLPCHDKPDDETTDLWPLAVLTWVLGDVLQDDDFKDAVIDFIIEKTKICVKGYNFFPIKTVTTLAYENTLPGSHLRKLLVDQHVYHGVSGWFDEVKIDQLHKEFLRDLSVALLENRKKPTATAPDRSSHTCKYHEHARKGSRCYKSK